MSCTFFYPFLHILIGMEDKYQIDKKHIKIYHKKLFLSTDIILELIEPNLNIRECSASFDPLSR